MTPLRIKIIQPSRIVLDTTCDHCIVPGSAGDLGIYINHTPIISTIRPGTLIIYNGDKKDYYAIHDGFLAVEGNVVRIACEVIEKKNEIDKSRAEASQQRATERLSSKNVDIDYRRAEISLKRSLARIQTLSDL